MVVFGIIVISVVLFMWATLIYRSYTKKTDWDKDLTKLEIKDE